MMQLDVWNDVHTLSGILKAYLRRLPETIFRSGKVSFIKSNDNSVCRNLGSIGQRRVEQDMEFRQCWTSNALCSFSNYQGNEKM